MFEATFEVDGKTFIARDEQVKSLFGDGFNTVLKVYETDGDAVRDINPENRTMSSYRIPDDVKPGDKVIYSRHNYGMGYKFEVLEVTRVTKTTVTAYNIKFVKRTGYQYGSSGSFCKSFTLQGYNEDYVAYMTARNLCIEYEKQDKERREKLIAVFNKAAKTADISLLEEALAVLGGK